MDLKYQIKKNEELSGGSGTNPLHHLMVTLKPFKFENRKCAVITFEDKSESVLSKCLLGFQAELLSKKAEED